MPSCLILSADWTRACQVLLLGVMTDRLRTCGLLKENIAAF